MEGRVSLGFGLLSGKECCIAGESFPCLGEFDFFFFSPVCVYWPTCIMLCLV